jgi:hypothetical protein
MASMSWFWMVSWYSNQKLAHIERRQDGSRFADSSISSAKNGKRIIIG